MKRMKPQPPEGTVKVQQLGGTDSFECLGFGIDAPNYVMLAVVHRPIGSTVRPVCKDGVWYWANPEGLRTRHLVAGTQHPLVVAPNLAEKKIEKGC